MSTFMLDKTNGKFLGVCAGIANYTGWDATWVRVAAVLLTFTGVFSILPLIYIAVAWIAPTATI